MEKVAGENLRVSDRYEFKTVRYVLRNFIGMKHMALEENG